MLDSNELVDMIIGELRTIVGSDNAFEDAVTCINFNSSDFVDELLKLEDPVSSKIIGVPVIAGTGTPMGVSFFINYDTENKCNIGTIKFSEKEVKKLIRELDSY